MGGLVYRRMFPFRKEYAVFRPLLKILEAWTLPLLGFSSSAAQAESEDEPARDQAKLVPIGNTCARPKREDKSNDELHHQEDFDSHGTIVSHRDYVVKLEKGLDKAEGLVYY